MKNFTNNFKQFTSRLSARWLIMALMMLVGTSSAWAVDYYLRGTFNNWLNGGMQDAYKFAGGSGTVKVNLTAGTYSFKIATNNWSEAYSVSNSTMKRDNCSNWQLYTNNGDLNIEADVTGEYSFNFNSSKKLTITYPPQCTKCCTNYYVAGDAGLCGENWSVNADEMTCSDNVWTKTFTNVNNGTYYFQITNGTWDVKKGDYDNTKGNITLSNVDDGYGAKKIKLTTTSKGDITISFDGSKAWVDFVQPCFTASDVEPGSISSNVDNNAVCGSSQVTLTLSNTTTKEGLSQSIQWQKKSGTSWNDIPNATNPKYEESVSVTTLYRAKVTWTKTDCNDIIEYANESGFTVTVNALPSAPQFDAAPLYCAGDNITLPTKDNAKNNVTWYKEDGTAAGTPANTAGTYIYKAKATNANGCVSSDFGTYSYTVKSIPAKANFTYKAPTNLVFDNNSAKTATVEWADSNNKGGDITVYYSSTTGSYKSATAVNVGTYYVFVKAEAGGNFCATTDYVEVGSFEITCNNNSAAQYTLNTAEFTYNGDKQVPTIKVDTGAGTVKETIYKKNGVEVTNPTAVGTYEVYITTNAGTGYCAISTATRIGEFTIKCKEVTDINTLYSLSTTSFPYNASKQVPTINVADYAGTVASTTYKQGETQIAEPIEVGTYDVYITTNEGNGYCAITNETKVGTFEIVCPDFAEPELIQNESVKRCNGQTIEGGKGSIKVKNYESIYKGKGYTFLVDGTEVSISEDGVLSKEIDIDNSKSEQEYTVTVRNNCGNEKNGKVTISVENVTPTIGDITISGAGSFCKNTEITLSCNIAGEGTTYQWYKNNTSISGETDQTLTVIVTENATYKVEVIKNTPCRVSRISESVDIVALTRPEAPKFNPETQTVCAEAELTLPTPTNIGSYEISWSIKDAKNTPIVLPLNETTTFVATLSNNGCISEETEYTVNVNPLPVPVISADFEAVNVGETITLTVEGDNIKNIEWYATDGTKEYNVTEITANQATITSDENAIITVTVTATSANDCVATTTKDVTFGSENCEISNADYVEVLCRTSDGKRDMYCYAWKDGTTVELLGGYPGQKTKDGEFEYKGVKYAVWQIKTDSKIDVIFGNGTTKTGDITGLEKGKRYVYTLTNYNTATLKETASNIFVPEVKTISVVPVRQQNGTIKVSLSGKIMKKGCTSISSYGFQYKKVGGDYTNIEVGTTDQDAGFVYTKEFTIPNQQYGEYVFRARLVNANSTKVYGEEIHVYYYESDAFIAVVGDDYDVTNKDGVYYDFVGLYVKNVVIPSGANISSYEWQVKESTQWVRYNNGEATVADRGVTAASNNIRPNEAGEYRCVITLSNGTRLESNVIEIKSTATYDEKITATNRNLPVISVRTNVDFPTCETAGTTGNYPSTNIPGWKKKRSVDVKIFNADGSLYYDRKARMNYRGSSSLNFNKKSYAFCPGDENCGGEDGPDYVKTKKMNLFGLSSGAEDKDWVLYAASADPTLMRNRLVFDTYSEMTGKWGVNSMYVELVIDGKYQGVYVLMDKITNNKNRTYVGKYGNKDYTGGFIVKFDKTDIADRERSLLVGQELGDEKTFMTSRTGRLNIDTYHTKVDQLFEIEYPEKDDVEDEGESWSSVLGTIQQQFEEFETALANGDYLKVRSLIDYQSWADWFIINEFTKNVDAYRASCIFTYKGEGHKIEALPLWDQELSFNNAAGANIGKKGANVTNGLLIEHNGVYTDCFPAPFWFTGRTSNFNTCGTDGGESTEGSKIENYLLKDECFVATIKERWKEHTKEGGALHKTQLTGKLALLVDELGAAKDREIAKWPSDHRVADACGAPGTGYNDVSFTTSYTALYNWIKDDLTSVNAENASYNRVTNLNYLINKMEGEPLLFDLTVNPINGVTTPWIPVTITVEAPEGYEYTYDDSAIKTEKGVIIKHVGDKYSYTFPRPEAWPTGNVDTPIAPKFYEVEVKLNVSAVDNSCGGTFKTDKKTTITLQDEGNDLCTYVEP